MANIIVIACPQCDKQMKVPEALIGKKIRCKDCNTAFPVKKPRGAPVESEPAEVAKEEAKPKSQDEEDDDGKNPYALAESDEGIARCPFCTKELESREARICLHCGYDMLKRVRADRRAVYEPTGEDKFKWLLPGIICTVVMIMVLTVSILIFVKTRSWMVDSWFEDEDNKGKYLVRPGCFMLVNGLITSFICFNLGKFAFRRLVLDNRPPEREIEKDDEGDDE